MKINKILTNELRDKNQNDFTDPGFLENQEIQPTIMAIESLIQKALPNTTKIMYRKTEVLKECIWTETEAFDLFIFDKNVFPNKSQESGVIWNEIMGNIIAHIKGLTENPLEWTIKHKFWLNSKYICLLLGISMFEKRETTDTQGK
jgi:hypothetical protein